MDINYKITMHSYWHCGSGLSKGAEADAIVIKEKDDLPYIPGKTLKGLIKEGLMDYMLLSGKNVNQAMTAFGTEGEKSEMFFSNAVLSEDERRWLVKDDRSHFLYKYMSRTAIADEYDVKKNQKNVLGTASQHSLRTIEVTVPCELHAQILDVPEALVDEIIEAFGMIKNLGVNRNRGLGRCTISVEEGGLK